MRKRTPDEGELQAGEPLWIVQLDPARGAAHQPQMPEVAKRPVHLFPAGPNHGRQLLLGPNHRPALPILCQFCQSMGESGPDIVEGERFHSIKHGRKPATHMLEHGPGKVAVSGNALLKRLSPDVENAGCVHAGRQEAPLRHGRREQGKSGHISRSKGGQRHLVALGRDTKETGTALDDHGHARPLVSAAQDECTLAVGSIDRTASESAECAVVQAPEDRDPAECIDVRVVDTCGIQRAG